MNYFRILLGIMIVWIMGLTAVVGINHGWNLIPIFFGDIISLTWPGQFNADFMCFLVLSGLWVAWRHQFSSLGWFLMPIAFFFGIMFLSIYLLVISFTTKGEIKAMLIGTERMIKLKKV
jgi:hypothetical protein